MFLAEIDKDTIAPSGRSMTGTTVTQQRPQKAPFQPTQGRVPQRPSAVEHNEYSQIPMPKRYTSASQPKNRNVPSAGTPSMRVGQRVKHPMFGPGTISAISGAGQNEKATVLFDNGQRKQLMVAFARLEIIG